MTILGRIHIERFKSLYDVKIELGQVNVFIGANGSGKSNLLEAIGVIGAAGFGSVDDQALLRRSVRPGVPRIYKSAFPKSPKDPSIRMDLIVIAIDLDIAIRAGVAKLPANLDAYDATELCTLMKSWLPEPVPGKVIIAIPVMATEAWILAALFPKLAGVERLPDPAGVLVKRDKIEQGRNGPWKRASEYRSFADTVANKLKRVRKECREANRFVGKLENVRATLPISR